MNKFPLTMYSYNILREQSLRDLATEIQLSCKYCGGLCGHTDVKYTKQEPVNYIRVNTLKVIGENDEDYFVEYDNEWSSIDTIPKSACYDTYELAEQAAKNDHQY